MSYQTSASPAPDIAALRKALEHYNGLGRANGVYANDDISALLDRVERAEAKLARVYKQHTPRATKSDYRENDTGGIHGVEMRFWCDACGHYFWADEKCEGLREIEGITNDH